MDEVQQQTVGVSYAPCPPEEFCGRVEERERLGAMLAGAGERGQAVMISGPPGIGKSSLVNRLAYDVRELPGGLQSPVLRAEVFDLPGMIFSAFRGLVGDLARCAASGRFKETLDHEGIREAIRYADDVLEKYAAPVEPVGLLSKSGEEVIGIFARSPEVGYDRVRQAFLELLRELGRRASGTGRVAAVLLEDVHLASALDRRLLGDIAHDLPAGILLAFTCRTGDGAGRFEEIGAPDLVELPLQGMRGDEIRELARRRFGLAIDEAAADLLEAASSDPFSLMACFNALRRRDLAPTAETIADLLAGAPDPAALAFATLSGPYCAWAENLCVLHPPFPVPVMACMLDPEGTGPALVTERLQESGIFRRLPGGEYAFAHPLLQEHCRHALSADAKIALNARAAGCFERSMHRLSGRLHVLLSLACHFFHARDHAKAADLNLELGLRFYHREDYGTALVMTERAVASAEHLGDDALLSAARRQQDLVRRKAGR
ncbi:ATP-binding protein [Methanoculleus sp. Wushi-C6]|uniref:ATP-binding protein n=1 Tax=Methanoculleus caldifontis TaxID=2651577 RepID=A0ABU3X2N4_9EURY|nr:ATP-binding protein [Methanoculleus sp. Wushi-C6]MDV2482324.1 ATP-binding protein [Methanoculleus sp. Wushi-C6]